MPKITIAERASNQNCRWTKKNWNCLWNTGIMWNQRGNYREMSIQTPGSMRSNTCLVHEKRTIHEKLPAIHISLPLWWGTLEKIAFQNWIIMLTQLAASKCVYTSFCAHLTRFKHLLNDFAEIDRPYRLLSNLVNINPPVVHCEHCSTSFDALFFCARPISKYERGKKTICPKTISLNHLSSDAQTIQSISF